MTPQKIAAVRTNGCNAKAAQQRQIIWPTAGLGCSRYLDLIDEAWYERGYAVPHEFGAVEVR